MAGRSELGAPARQDDGAGDRWWLLRAVTVGLAVEALVAGVVIAAVLWL